MNRFYYYLFLFFLFLFKNTSFWFLYRVSDLFYLFLLYVLKYRREVVMENLRISFPEKSPEELQRIARGFYHHLCDIVVEGVKAFSMKEKDIRKRYQVTNPEILDPWFKRKKSVMVVLGHYNNWEWGSLAGGIYFKHNPVAFYRPISNPFIDNYVRKTRAKMGMTLEPVSRTSKTFKELRDTPSMVIMVADQSPMNLKQAFHVHFLGQDTAVMHGTEKHAVANDYPLFFVDVQKVKRGFYNVTFEPLVESPVNREPGFITQQFMNRLEQQIRKDPRYWLWSHRRWKHTR